MRYVIHISISVQYLVFLYEYLKEWRKNPQWSFSCCLALLLPVNDLQGEIRGMVGKNLMKTQLDKGILKKPSIAAAALESGAMRFTLCPEKLQSEDERAGNSSSRTTLKNFIVGHKQRVFCQLSP